MVVLPHFRRFAVKTSHFMLFDGDPSMLVFMTFFTFTMIYLHLLSKKINRTIINMVLK